MAVPPENVSIVIPAFHEEAAVGGVVAALCERFADAEVIVVDDGSGDATGERSTEAGADVLTHDVNRGYGASLKTGTRAAGRDWVLFCDADGQHAVDDVEKLLQECDGHDMVVGRRGKDSHREWIRRPGKLVLSAFANALAGRRIPDLNSGLRLFRRDTLLRYLHLMPDGFSFSTTSTFAMLKSNRRVKWVPITAHRRVGTSTVSQFRHGPQTLLLMLRLSVLFEPLKVFTAVATLLFSLGVASLIVDLGRGSSGLADTTVLLYVSAVIVFMSGLLCDQISALRREKHE